MLYQLCSYIGNMLSRDNTFAVLMKWFRKMKNDASDALSDIRNKNRHTTDELI